MDTRFEGSIFERISSWVQKADEMSQITRNLKSEIAHTFEHVRDGRAAKVLRILPAISVYRNNVYCNGILIPTARMRTPVELFKVFLQDPLASFTREQLVSGILNQMDSPERSEETARGLTRNLTKMISRARLVAEESVNPGRIKWIEWFPFDTERHLWSFYRLTNAYLWDKQNSLMGAVKAAALVSDEEPTNGCHLRGEQ